MYSFLVLGIIPGTNLQITFQVWLNTIGLLLIGLAFRILYANRHQIELALQPVRVPLHAREIHARLQY
jgi:hypothetical protein